MKGIDLKNKTKYLVLFLSLSFVFFLSQTPCATAKAGNNSPKKKPLQTIQKTDEERAITSAPAAKPKKTPRRKVKPKLPQKTADSHTKAKTEKTRYKNYPSSSKISQKKDYITLDFKGEIKDLIKMLLRAYGEKCNLR